MEFLLLNSTNIALRSLLSATAHDASAHDTGGDEEVCYCMHPHSPGTLMEHHAAMACSWIAMALSIAILIFYAYHYFKDKTGWEEVYVCSIELAKVLLEIFAEVYSPATIVQVNGVHTSWLRYAEWLLTCPVILIHLSNITGLQNDYNRRTMSLLISDIGTIVMGVTAAYSRGPVKVVFFCLGLCYGANTFFTAAKVYLEAHREVPEGECKMLVKAMAYVFFSSWLAFPILFLMGPEGFGHITAYGSIVGHTVIDLMSKNIWGLMGHHLRCVVADYVAVHGDFRKPKADTSAEAVNGFLSPFYQPEDPGVTAIIQTRSATSKPTVGCYSQPMSPTKLGATAAAAAGAPVCVILGVTDLATVEYFQQQVALLPIPVEVTPAINADAVLSLAATATADVALLGPEYVAGSDLIVRLKALGLTVVVYGWTPATATVINASGADGFIEGPSIGAPINTQQLMAVLTQVQAARTGAQTGGLLRTFSNTSLASPTAAAANTYAASPLGRNSRNSFSIHRAASLGSINPSLSRVSGSFIGMDTAGAGLGTFSNAAAAAPVAGAAGASGIRTPGRLSFDRGQAAAAATVTDAARASTGAAAGALSSALYATSSTSVKDLEPSAAATAAASDGSQPAAAGQAGNVRSIAGLNQSEVLQQLLREIARLKQEVGEDGF